jgi:hypothetical protein
MSYASAHGTTKIITGLAAKLGGKVRGGDPVHRHSIDENAPDAQPWEHNRFATTAERIATVETLIQTAQELSALHYKRFPRKQLFALKAGHGALTAEIERLMGMSPAERPVGRLATVRQELAAIDAELAEAEQRLRPVDVNVLRAILSFMCGKTGRMFPSAQEIAARAICCIKGVWRSLARLRHHGFIDRIRRSRKKANSDGHFGPQREQTSHAYFLNHRRTMAKRIYQRFIQLREMRWKRLGKNTPAPASASPETPKAVLRGNSPLADAIHRLGISLANANP